MAHCFNIHQVIRVAIDRTTLCRLREGSDLGWTPRKIRTRLGCHYGDALPEEHDHAEDAAMDQAVHSSESAGDAKYAGSSVENGSPCFTFRSANPYKLH